VGTHVSDQYTAPPIHGLLTFESLSLTLRGMYVPQALTFRNSTFYPHGAFMCFACISEQTAIISLYRINWSVYYNRDKDCLLCGTNRVFKPDRYSFVIKR